MHYTFRTRPRGVPWWFWVIVLFQCRAILWGVFGFITHEPGRYFLSGANALSEWVVVVSGLPALIMAIMYALEVTSGVLRRIALILMVLASLTDIIMKGHGVIAPDILTEERYFPSLMVLFNVICILALISGGRLRRALLPGREHHE